MRVETVKITILKKAGVLCGADVDFALLALFFPYETFQLFGVKISSPNISI